MMHLPRATKIVCVGRNYAAHARELGNDVPERPLLFLKPPSALLPDGGTIVLPPDSAQVEHEGEIGVVIGRTARHVRETDAPGNIAGVVALNDVTARDLQRLDVQFTRAKGFDTFCPVGDLASMEGRDWRTLRVVCRVNGVVRQQGRASEMVFGVPYLVAYISGIMTLEPGDIIATGTPAGVGPLQDGDEVEVVIPELSVVRSRVRAAGVQEAERERR